MFSEIYSDFSLILSKIPFRRECWERKNRKMGRNKISDLSYVQYQPWKIR